MNLVEQEACAIARKSKDRVAAIKELRIWSSEQRKITDIVGREPLWEYMDFGDEYMPLKNAIQLIDTYFPSSN